MRNILRTHPRKCSIKGFIEFQLKNLLFVGKKGVAVCHNPLDLQAKQTIDLDMETQNEQVKQRVSIDLRTCSVKKSKNNRLVIYCKMNTIVFKSMEMEKWHYGPLCSDIKMCNLHCRNVLCRK